MREVVILAIHLLVTLAKLLPPGGVRAVAAESLLLKHQLLISNRSRQRAPNLTSVHRPVDGVDGSARLMRNVSKCALSNANVEVSILTEPIRQVGVRKIDGAGDPGGSSGQENCMKRIMLTSVLLALAASTQQQTLAAGSTQKAGDVPAASTAAVPAGSYNLDKQHASLIFRVNHLGFSNYTARFKRFDARLQFDPENLAASKVVATVDASSLETDFPDPTQVDFNALLKGDEWLNVAKFPEMKFESKQIDVTGANTVHINGDLTLHGVTRPIMLEARFNGGYAGHPMDPNARIGFSAHGTLQRSEFGIAYGIPAPGTTLGVGDDVNVIIEAEFTGPPWAGTQKAGRR